MSIGRWLLAVVLVVTAMVGSCKKWQDAAPVDDPRLTNPYCNDVDAVNYNWGFPGKPDNTKCFYPTDLFIGTYVFTDSVYLTTTGDFLYAQPETLQVYSISKSKIALLGFCGGNDSLFMTAGKDYVANMDTLVGDTLTARGQLWCRNLDTVFGNLTINRLDSLLGINFTVVSDTAITNHYGRAKKLL